MSNNEAVTMTSNEFKELKSDIADIKKYLLGNGRPGALDRIKELEVRLQELEKQYAKQIALLNSSEVPKRLNAVEIQQKECPARKAATFEGRAYKVQFIATMITAVSALALVAKMFI